MIGYTIDVPLFVSRAVNAGPGRFACCQRTEEQGHSTRCTPERRAVIIEAALKRANIPFHRLPPVVTSETVSASADTVT